MNRKNIAIKSIVASTLVSLALSATLLSAVSMLAYRAPDPDKVATPLGISTLVISFALCGVTSGMICLDKIEIVLSCVLFAAPQAIMSLAFGDGKPITIMAASTLSFVIGWLILNGRSNKRHAKIYYKSRR